MKKIHPDKNKGNQLFDSFVKKANDAYAEDDFIKLLSIASELDIKINSKNLRGKDSRKDRENSKRYPNS